MQEKVIFRAEIYYQTLNIQSIVQTEKYDVGGEIFHFKTKLFFSSFKVSLDHLVEPLACTLGVQW